MSALLATYFMLVSCVAYSSTLKMEATRSSEMSDDFSTNYTALYPRRQNSSTVLHEVSGVNPRGKAESHTRSYQPSRGRFVGETYESDA
jgi:hypothetical protein